MSIPCDKSFLLVPLVQGNQSRSNIKVTAFEKISVAGAFKCFTKTVCSSPFLIISIGLLENIKFLN